MQASLLSSLLLPLLSTLSPAGARGRLSILIWHRVLPQQDPIFPDEMYAARFDQTLAWIKQMFHVMPLPEAVAALRQNRLPARTLAITFDDGYADNYHVAMPILQAHGLSATFFITTGFLDGGRMWNDSLIETVRAAPAGLLDAGPHGQFHLSDGNDGANHGAASRRVAIQTLIERIKYLEINERQATVDALAARAGVTLPQNLMMTRAEVRAMHAAGMTIGAHTRSHPILCRLPLAAARTEIAEGRAELEEIIGSRVSLFAYPNGRPQQDYERSHVELVRELGFDAAVSTAWGASGVDDDLFQLRRFTPWDRQPLRYAARLARNLFANRQYQLV